MASAAEPVIDSLAPLTRVAATAALESSVMATILKAEGKQYTMTTLEQR